MGSLNSEGKMDPSHLGDVWHLHSLIPFATDGVAAAGAGAASDPRALLALALLALASLLYRLYRNIRPLAVPPTVPGPDRYPLLGILPSVVPRFDDWPAESLRLCRKYGWTTWGGPAPNFGGSPGAWFFLVDEGGLKHVLSDNFANYVKSRGGMGFRDLYGELLGNGIFATDGEQWVTHRKVASNMFSRNLMRHSARVTLGKLREIVDLLNDAIMEGSGPAAEFDVQDLFFRMTFDTTSLVAFGCEFDSIRRKTQHPFALAFDEMQIQITERVTDPFFPHKRLLRLGKRERRIRYLKGELDRHAESFIRGKRRSADDSNRELGPDILSRFLDHSRKTGESMSDRDLRDVVMNILLAGRDTTACALSWTFWELTKRPDVVDNIVDEVGRVCGGTGDDVGGGDGDGGGAAADYSYDAMSKLRYTHAVVLESLRLHPSVTNDHKYAVRDDVHPDGTRIPAGAAVAYMPYAMGRCEKIWGEDALEFRPERFLDGDGGLCKEPSQFKYPVFNAGPRLCLGKPLALTTMKLTLAYLLPRFEFVDRRGHDGSYRWTMVRAMKGGFKVDVSKRK